MRARVLTPAMIFLALIVGSSILFATAFAVPSISVKVTGVPAEVDYGSVLKGSVEITISGLDSPSPALFVSFFVLEGDSIVSQNAVVLEGRGNGVHKLPLSGTPVMALSSKPQARLHVWCNLETGNGAIEVRTDVLFGVKGARSQALYQITGPKLELTLEKGTIQGKSVREITAALSYSVKLGELADEKKRLTIHESLEVTGPVRKTLPSQTVYPQPGGKLCEVRSLHAPFAVTEPGVYTYHYRIDCEGGSPETGTAEIEVPAEEAAQPERALLIDSATVTPSGPVGRNFKLTLTYHATDLPLEGANVQEWIHFEGPADQTLMVERVVEDTGKRTSVYEATFGNPGSYSWRVSVAARGLKSAAKEMTSEVTPATAPVPTVPVYVCKGPIVRLDEKEGKPLPAGLTVGELSLTYAVELAPGERHANIISWNTPPLSLQEGQNVILTLNCSGDPAPVINASWTMDCNNGAYAGGIGLVASGYGDPRSSSYTFSFKPRVQRYPTFIRMDAGRFGDSRSVLSLEWKYELQEGGSALTTLKDVTSK